MKIWDILMNLLALIIGALFIGIPIFLGVCLGIPGKCWAYSPEINGPQKDVDKVGIIDVAGILI